VGYHRSMTHTKQSYAMTLEQLRSLLDSGEFHHATYRDIGKLWEGLNIYRKSATGFRGFEGIGIFPKDDPDLAAAHDLVWHTGVSVGSYGRG
jgi:hypothetical protein